MGQTNSEVSDVCLQLEWSTSETLEIVYQFFLKFDFHYGFPTGKCELRKSL